MNHKFSVVREKGKDSAPRAVKCQMRNHWPWYTAVECYCVPGMGNADEIARIIAKALNSRVEDLQRAQDCLDGMQMLEKHGIKKFEVSGTASSVQ